MHLEIFRVVRRTFEEFCGVSTYLDEDENRKTFRVL